MFAKKDTKGQERSEFSNNLQTGRNNEDKKNATSSLTTHQSFTRKSTVARVVFIRDLLDAHELAWSDAAAAKRRAATGD